VRLQHCKEMLWVFLPNVFDAKVVHHQGELYGTPDVLPQTRDYLALVLTVGVESFFQEFVGQ
jgi:hypothetical protein